MAELVIGPLLSMVKEKASNYLLEHYKVMEGMEVQRKILERNLPAILYIIQDAEEKGASRHDVAAWLKDLKTAAYEANDVFDEFKYEALRREAKKKGQHSKLGKETARFLVPARNPIVFRYRMGKKLRRIVQTIEDLVTEMNKFDFRHLQQAQPSSQWRQTDSIIIDSDRDIVSRSRYQEKEKIVGMLLDQASSDMDLMVLPVVGPGGMGKTTFVQLIYNDPAIRKHFELQRWCCVSDDFEVHTIASNICESSEKGREKTLRDLQSIISGKRYLIVLDDVWNRDADKWGKLKTCLKQGGKGSAVLTTTRDSKVAEIMAMGVDGAHYIEKLSEVHLREIVQSRAFSLQNPNSDELDHIFGRIVDRCAGSPLAAKVFGSMLSNKTSMNEWKHTLAKSDICNETSEIFPILKLSFDDLPSHMKQCFAFCALFPKDYEIDVDLLIHLWMAHDFIPAQDGDQPETVGAQIFNELTCRSFFQDVKQTFPYGHSLSRSLSLRKRTICKIHDLMHDIALSVMGKECATVVGKPTVNKLLQNPSRHIFLSVYGASVIFRKRLIISSLDHLLKKQPAMLQTLFFTDYYDPLDISQYTSLRALHLPAEDYSVQKHLTGQIQHLRYLNLSGHRFVQLPEDISVMYNLQTLDLSYCINLRQLPMDMKYMASLRHLYTHGCNSLTCMPPGLGQITSLQTLTYFVAGASSDCSTIGELGNLNLGGELELSGLENVTETSAKRVRIEHKEKIRHLSLKWDIKGEEDSVQMDCHKKVLHALNPHDCLQTLRIVNYRGTSLPSWVTDLRKLQHLTELHLSGCTLCEEFPQFHHFKALEVLYLERLDKLQSLCSDMVFAPFPALKQLQLHDLESLARWVATGGKEGDLTFPVLEKIDIENCPKLSSLPEAPKLKVIRLDEGNSLLSLEIIKSRHMTSLSELELSVRDTEASPQTDPNCCSSQQLEQSFGDREAAPLLALSISGCNFFFFSSQSEMTFVAWKSFEKLVHLRIKHCDALIYWPEQVFKSLASLKFLSIMYCNKLIGPKQVTDDEPTQTTEQVLPHLNMISVWGCKCLVQLFILPPSLRSIDIMGCPRLEFIWEKEKHLEAACTSLEHCQDTAPPTGTPGQSPFPMIRCPCLVNLEIRDCANLVTLPYLPPSLKELVICNCGELRSASGQLGELEKLHIYNCNKLHSVNSLEDASSLETLFVSSCQCLASLGSSGGPGNFSALRGLRIEYCPAMDMKQFNKNVLDGLVQKEISHARSSDPHEGPKLWEPRSWKYAIP